jgi:hypothetical protein
MEEWRHAIEGCIAYSKSDARKASVSARKASESTHISTPQVCVLCEVTYKL